MRTGKSLSPHLLSLRGQEVTVAWDGEFQLYVAWLQSSTWLLESWRAGQEAQNLCEPGPAAPETTTLPMPLAPG